MQETEASRQALKEAEQAEAKKHAAWTEAEQAGKAADKFAHDKLAKVENTLESKMASLTTESKVRTQGPLLTIDLLCSLSASPSIWKWKI